MATAGEFPTGLCGCCDVKDCGISCCCSVMWCMPCNFGSAMEAADVGSCCACCCCVNILPPCTVTYARGRLAEKYNIDEAQWLSCIQSFCCLWCSAIQIINLVLVKENKTWGCFSVN